MKERKFGIVCSVKSSEGGSRRYHIQYAAVSATKTSAAGGVVLDRAISGKGI